MTIAPGIKRHLQKRPSFDWYPLGNRPGRPICSRPMASQLRSNTAQRVRDSVKINRRSVVVRAAGANWPGNKVEQWFKTPFDVAAFGPRAALGALLSLPERLQTLPTDVQRAAELVQDPRPIEEKQQAVLQEVEDTLVSFLERGATVETDVLSNIKLLLPPDITKQLDELIPPPPNAQPTQQYDSQVEEQPLVVYTADSVLENQIAAEMTEIKVAVSALKASLEDVRSNTDPARSSMLRLNLKEARDILARRLQETAPGVAPAGSGTDTSLSAATREASVLLDEVDAQFFAKA